LSGFAGQQILIDLDNKRIIVVNSLYRNYNWKKIVNNKSRTKATPCHLDHKILRMSKSLKKVSKNLLGTK
jgi:hypothetical protein